MFLYWETTELLLIAGIAAFFVGLSKGGLPSIGMLGVPILSMMISPLRATVVLLPIFVISDIVGVYLYRRQFSLRNLQVLIPAGLFGVAVGWAIASLISDAILTLLIGLTGIGFCLNMWLRPKTNEVKGVRKVAGFFWGSLAGFTSFISHSGAPPFQIYMLPQRLPKLEFAGTSTIFFAAVNAAKIIPYQQLQPYTYENLQGAMVLVPCAILGTWVGANLTKRINEKLFYLFVQVSLFLISFKLVFGVLWT